MKTLLSQLPTLTLAAAHCMAWSPRVHALQTAQAKRLVPAGMARYLDGHESALMEAGAGAGNAAVPTPEAVEEQFHRVLDMSEGGRPPAEIARELGRLANMAQLLTDPSATAGFTFVRGEMSAFADEHLKRLVAVREPLFAATDGVGPRAAIALWDRLKYERFRVLSAHVDPRSGGRVGQWDTLSVPYAQMQLGFSAGVNATANLWIFAWRAVGDLWAGAAQPHRPKGVTCLAAGGRP